MSADLPGLSAAAVFIILCVATFWWATLPSSVGRRHVLLVFVWLCAALAATLVVFSLFPASTAEGGVLGFTLGGAGAFVVLVWMAALRAGRTAERFDQLESEARELRQRLHELETEQRPRQLDEMQTLHYTVKASAGVKKRRIGVVTGDIRQTRCAEVWVNSENTDMRMARTQDHTISGLIRYEGAVRSPTGQVVEDVIADELHRIVGDRVPVAAGTVVLTKSGGLGRIGVKRIAHVATVHGGPGAGFVQVQEIGRCVTNVLQAVGSPTGEYEAATVLFPLLGAGQGGGTLQSTVRTMVMAIMSHFTNTPNTSIETVYLLAYTDAELKICHEVMDSLSNLRREDD